MPGNTSFKQKWVTRKIKRPWLQSVKGDRYSAFCLACDAIFKEDNGGVSQLQRHEETKGHIKRILEYNQSRTIVTMAFYKYRP